MKTTIMVFLALFLVGGASGCAGSPDIVVNKNITVTVEGVQANPQNPYYPFPVYIDIKYTTKSDIPVTADVKQSAKDAFKADVPMIP